MFNMRVNYVIVTNENRLQWFLKKFQQNKKLSFTVKVES